MNIIEYIPFVLSIFTFPIMIYGIIYKKFNYFINAFLMLGMCFLMKLTLPKTDQEDWQEFKAKNECVLIKYDIKNSDATWKCQNNLEIINGFKD